MGGIGNLGAWVRGSRESNFGMSLVGRMGPQNFDGGHKNCRGQNFGVDETYGFMNFYHDSIKFYL